MVRRYRRLQDLPRDDQGAAHCATLPSPADERAQLAAARDNPEAFIPLYQRYLPPVYRYVVQHVGSGEDAQDLTALIFSKALASLDRYAEKGSVAAWLFSIARHTVQDYHRRRRPTVDLAQVEAQLVDPAPPPDVEVLRREDAHRLHTLLRRLPADQREALALRFFGELPSKDIAAVLDRSEGAVRTLIYRALLRLRDAYVGEDRP